MSHFRHNLDQRRSKYRPNLVQNYLFCNRFTNHGNFELKLSQYLYYHVLYCSIHYITYTSRITYIAHYITLGARYFNIIALISAYSGQSIAVNSGYLVVGPYQHVKFFQIRFNNQLSSLTDRPWSLEPGVWSRGCNEQVDGTV